MHRRDAHQGALAQCGFDHTRAVDGSLTGWSLGPKGGYATVRWVLVPQGSRAKRLWGFGCGSVPHPPLSRHRLLSLFDN